MQAAAQAEGASAITQDDATEVQFPDPDLAKAVFSSPAEAVSEPVKGQLGWFVVKVTKITAGSVTTFEQAKDRLRTGAVAAKAADLMYERANKLDQLLGNGTRLDDLPGDLGVVGRGRDDGLQGRNAGERAGADPRPDRAEGGDHRGGVPGQAGRPAAADRSANPVNRRVGVLRADGGKHHSARHKAVRGGERPGDRRLEAGPAAAVPGSRGNGDDDRGSGRKIVLRCRDRRRRCAETQSRSSRATKAAPRFRRNCNGCSSG